MESATYIISRCGYSTVMDIATVKKKALMIPTPGQTEQEYLAKYLMENKIALCLPQSKFKLKAALELANSFPYQMEMEPENKGLQTAVASLMERLNS
jgi:UDP-N-acetylglucosamine:LPS N-acetylglucosamine transferase